jgi:hypothetical protein
VLLFGFNAIALQPDDMWEFETQWYAITGAMADEKEAKEAKEAGGGDVGTNAGSL